MNSCVCVCVCAHILNLLLRELLHFADKCHQVDGTMVPLAERGTLEISTVKYRESTSITPPFC